MFSTVGAFVLTYFIIYWGIKLKGCNKVDQMREFMIDDSLNEVFIAVTVPITFLSCYVNEEILKMPCLVPFPLYLLF